MAKICANCGKTTIFGSNIPAHSKKSSKRKFRPNLHKYLGKWFCSSCIREQKSGEKHKDRRHSQAVETI